MSTARKVLSNTTYQIIGKVITAALGIISVKLVTNYLGDTYGEYSVIYDYIALFAIVADFGLFTIAVREMAHDEKQAEKIIGNVLSIRTMLAVVSLGIGIFVAFLIPQYKDTLIPFGILITSLATVLAFLAGTIASVLQVFLKMYYAAFALIIGKIVTVAYIVAIILWWFPAEPTRGFLHLFFAWIVGNVITLALTYFSSRKFVKIRYRFDWDFLKEIIIKALPYGLALVIGALYFRMGTIIMSFFKLFDDIGIYAVAMRFLEILVIIPAFFMNSILPVLIKAIKEKSEKVKIIVQYAFDFMALAAFPTLVGGFLLAKPLVAAISNDEFVSFGDKIGSDVALRIVLFAMTFTFLHNAFGFTLVALGKQIKLLWINLMTAIINISLNLYFIPKYSFIAVAGISVFSEFFILILASYLVCTYLNLRLNLTLAFKALVASAAMGVIIYYIQPPLQNFIGLKSLFLSIPLGCLIYIAGLYLTKAFSPELIALLKKQKDTPAPAESLSVNTL